MFEQFVVTILLVVVSGGVESSEDKCQGALAKCLAALPLGGTGGLPTSNEQLVSLCNTYKAGSNCVESWSRDCLPEDKQRAARQQRQGVMLLMGLLCDDDNFRKGYLNYTTCFERVSGDWDRCVDIYRMAIGDSTTKSGSYSSLRGQLNICCASYAFNRCISLASKVKCSKEAAVMLRRISETLSADSVRTARCDSINTAVCFSGSPGSKNSSRIIIQIITVVVTTLWSTVFYEK